MMAKNEEGVPVDASAAEALEKHLAPTLFGPWAVKVAERAHLQIGDAVLDVGCGTGLGARAAAARVSPSGSVTGLDLDAGMLAVAERCAVDEGLTIQWDQGDALNLPYDDRAFDAVLCCQGLQFFPDKVKALNEMRRVLKPGGRVVASVWRDVSHCPGHDALAKAMAALSGKQPAIMPPFSLGSSSEIEAFAKSAGFGSVEVSAVEATSPFRSAADFVDSLANGAPSTRHALAALDQDVREAVVVAVTEALAEYTGDDGLMLPMASHILVVSKKD